MTDLITIPPLLGLAGLICAFIVYTLIKRNPVSNPAVIKIGDAIHTGAMVLCTANIKCCLSLPWLSQ